MATHFSILAWRIPMDRGAWQAIAHGVAERRTQLSDLHTDAETPIKKEEVTYLMITSPQTYRCPRAGNVNPCDPALSPHPPSEAPCTSRLQTPECPSTTGPFKMRSRGFPGGSEVKRPPPGKTQETRGSAPDSGGSLWSKESPQATTAEPTGRSY